MSEGKLSANQAVQRLRERLQAATADRRKQLLIEAAETLEGGLVEQAQLLIYKQEDLRCTSHRLLEMLGPDLIDLDLGAA